MKHYSLIDITPWLTCSEVLGLQAETLVEIIHTS